MRISSLVKIFDKSRFYSKHLDFDPNIPQSRFWSKIFLNLDWSEYFQNISILATIFKNSDFGKKKIFENFNLGENFRNISILIKIFENLNFGQNFRIISILVKFS